MKLNRESVARRQQGAVLVISLIILLVLTILGIAAMQSTTMEEKMAGNARNRDLAFQSAEAALREGEAYVENLTTTTGFSGAGGLYSEADPDPDWTSTAAWTSARTYGSYGGSVIQGVAQQPKYYIKIVAVVSAPRTSKVLPPNVGGTVTIFRITAKGWGSTTNSQVVLQSRYGKIF